MDHSTFPLQSDVDEISFMFPSISRDVIEADLNVSLCKERTVNRILDGTVTVPVVSFTLTLGE